MGATSRYVHVEDALRSLLDAYQKTLYAIRMAERFWPEEQRRDLIRGLISNSVHIKEAIADLRGVLPEEDDS